MKRDYLKCRYCAYENLLGLGWRNTGDYDDTEYVQCKKCRKISTINNRDFKSPYLIKKELE